MIRIPTDFQWKQANNSDLLGSLSATKNINLDEEGYVKLSSRTVSVYNETQDADLGTPLAFGRRDEGEFDVVTDDEGFEVDLSEGAGPVVAQEDGTNAENYNANSSGTWWQNRWYTTYDDGSTDNLGYKASNGNWTVGLHSLNDDYAHPIEVFRNRNTLCIGNGPAVVQLNTSHVVSTLAQLVLPDGYEVIGLSYSGYRLGIITKLDATIAGQNHDAFFFVWDGKSAEAGQGVPIGSDMAAGIVAYKGTWATITRAGQLVAWNGGGFTELAAFPFYFKTVTWGDFTNRVGKGRNMVVDGDTILINLNLALDQYGQLSESQLPYNPSGVWCYDPKAGLYHRYSPSFSPVYGTVALQAGVNTTTNIITKNTGTIPPTGSPAVYSDNQGSSIGGLTLRSTYYVIKLSSTTFQLAENEDLALNGVAIDLTSTGGSQHTFLMVDVLDYGATYISDAGGIALMGTQSRLYDHVILGAELNDTSTGNNNHIVVSMPNLENRGYFILPKMLAQRAEDAWGRLVLVFRPLGPDDKIIVKKKLIELRGLPTTTTQNNPRVTWSSSKDFYTTANLSAVKTAFDRGHEIECELISGAGAGTLEKVVNITEAAGTYAVELENAVPGASSTRTSEAMFDNYTRVLEIDSDGTYTQKGYVEVPLDDDSAWVKIKIELRGIETTVAPMLLLNSPKK